MWVRSAEGGVAGRAQTVQRRRRTTPLPEYRDFVIAVGSERSPTEPAKSSLAAGVLATIVPTVALLVFDPLLRGPDLLAFASFTSARGLVGPHIYGPDRST